MGFYVSAKGEEALRHYKYCGGDHSFMYRYVLTPMNKRLIHLFPRWMAPNTITSISFFVSIAIYATTAFYNRRLDQAMPPWVYVYLALSLFAYQTLDNLDGRQAVRTNSSSPLGMLFDHGVDALNASLQTCVVASLLQVGSGWKLWYLFFNFATAFYFTTWEEYHTGELFMGLVNGPSDGIFLCYTLSLLTALWPGVWALPITQVLGPEIGAPLMSVLDKVMPFAVLHLHDLILVVLTVGLVPTVAWSFFAVRRHYVRKNQSYLWHAISSALPYIILQAAFVGAMLYSPSRIFHTIPRRFVLGSGFTFSLIVCKIQIAHLVEERYTPFRKSLLPFCLASLNSIYGGLTGTVLVDEFVAFTVCFCATGLMWAHMAFFVIREFTAALGISAFSIPYDKSSKSK